MERKWLNVNSFCNSIVQSTAVSEYLFYEPRCSRTADDQDYVLARGRPAVPESLEPLHIISVGTIGLIKAVGSFSSDKNVKLATFASRCIENEILMYLRKVSNRKNEVSLDEPLSTDYDGNELLLSDVLGSEPDLAYKELEEGEEMREIIKMVGALPSREREIMSMRFGLFGYTAKTQKEIASELGISQSYISRLEKRIISKLKKGLEALV